VNCRGTKNKREYKHSRTSAYSLGRTRTIFCEKETKRGKRGKGKRDKEGEERGKGKKREKGIGL
jgi:hypothetical protein